MPIPIALVGPASMTMESLALGKAKADSRVGATEAWRSFGALHAQEAGQSL
jgi:hypothetical protein